MSIILILWSVLPADASSAALEEAPCPEKTGCALFDTFTKADAGFFRVAIMQKGAGSARTLVPNLRFNHRGRWTSYVKEEALPEGRNAYDIAAPRYSDQLTTSLDKGKRAHLQVILEMEAAGR